MKTRIATILATIVTSFVAFTSTPRALAQGRIWITKTPMPTARLGSAAAAIDGKLYVVGGYETCNGLADVALDMYDPVTETWTSKAPLPVPRFSLSVGVINGKLYAIGGATDCNSYPSATMFMYDPLTNVWVTKASLPVNISAAAVGVIGDQLYVAGGNGGGFETNRLYVYNAGTDTWTAKASMPTVRSNAAVGVMNNKLYVAGGFAGVCCFSEVTMIVYDPATDTWTSKAPLPSDRNGPSSGVIDGLLYVAGGLETDAGYTNTLFAYNPTTDTWSTKAPMSVTRYVAPSAVIDGELYVVGGLTNSGILASLEVYSRITPPTLNLPANITVDATSPSGAVVSYTASATDQSGSLPVVCSPASGATFAIGITVVNCAATNEAGTTNGTFRVLVQAAAAQVANLIDTIQSFNLAQGISNSLDAKLQNMVTALSAAKAGSSASTCNQLTAFINETSAQSGKQLTVDQASQLISSANRIKAVIGCP